MQQYQKFNITRDEIVPLAEKMRAEGIILTMIHAFLTDEGKVNLAYDYQRGEVIESYTLEVEQGGSVPTITHIYDMAANWPEREINELIDINFEGLDVSKRLFMPDSMLEGKGQIFVTPMDELIKKNRPEEQTEDNEEKED